MLNEFLEAVKFAWAWSLHIGFPAVSTFLWGCWTTLFKPGVLPVALISGLGGALWGGWATHHYLDQPAYDRLKSSYEAQDARRTAAVSQAAAQARATQAAISDRSGAKFEATRTRIVTQTETIIKEVPTYVTVQSDAVPCNSVGLVRVLTAAAEGRNPADLVLPPGVTDDTCTALTNAAVAASVAANYGIARLNAGQLDELIADVKARIDAANGSVPAGKGARLGALEGAQVDLAGGNAKEAAGGSSQLQENLAGPVVIPVPAVPRERGVEVGNAQIGVDLHTGAVVLQPTEAFLAARAADHAVAVFLVHTAAPGHGAEAARPLWLRTGGGGTGTGEWLGPRTIFGPDRFGNYTSLAIDGWYWAVDPGVRWLDRGIAA